MCVYIHIFSAGSAVAELDARLTKAGLCNQPLKYPTEHASKDGKLDLDLTFGVYT